MLRRELLKTGLTGASALVAGTVCFPTFAFDSPMAQSRSVAITLANALRSIGSQPCLAAAAALEARQNVDGDIRFHLRSAGINSADAATIAHALSTVPDEEAVSLVSLSLSYNQALGDAGATALAHALPYSLRELGLVGCGIGDRGGEALLQWTRRATHLRVMCIEENLFSSETKTQFTRLARANSDLFLVI